MDVTEEGMETGAREVQPSKAPFPMDVTEEGMATEIREVQPQKALYGIDVMLEGMVTCPFASGLIMQPPNVDLGRTMQRNATSSQPCFCIFAKR